jgi:enoyl-CoA hydratase
VLDQAGATAASLPPASRALLRDALDAGTDDADLAALVRSAAAPGIKDRIRKYLEPG